MIALLQRVSQAKVTVENQITGQIKQGLLVFLGICQTDTSADIDKLVKKICQLRIFSDSAGKMNHSVQDIGGEILVVSQFTLYADCKKGNRPSYINAAHPSIALPMYEQFVAKLNIEISKPIATGIFGAMMQVELVNDGPITIVLDTEKL
jgi:D-tyrosyl-tRNA(Tyr) deacylase